MSWTAQQCKGDLVHLDIKSMSHFGIYWYANKPDLHLEYSIYISIITQTLTPTYSIANPFKEHRYLGNRPRR